MPGAVWLPWVPIDETESIHGAGLRIAQHLKKLLNEGVNKVSSRKLKADLQITLSGGSWQCARDMALGLVPWTVEGQSLVTLFD